MKRARYIKMMALSVPRPPLLGVVVKEVFCPDGIRTERDWAWNMLEDL